MQIAEVQFYPWDKVYDFNIGNNNVIIKDKVIVQTEIGIEIGEIKNIKNIDESLMDIGRIKTILRKANKIDRQKADEKQKKAKEAIKYCKQIAEEYNLPIKIVCAYLSFDNSRLLFVFTAEGRIDFRELVKKLTKHFQKSIRMQQIGTRDEARTAGGLGFCGREFCCMRMLKKIDNIHSDLLRLQQLENKASERVSGCCGRLLCCLSYEQKAYEKCLKGMPKIGDIVKYERKKMTVVGTQILNRIVKIKDSEKNIIAVPVDKIQQ
ncbi:MAG: regulatory iron-sulfur-containing complex subunit RicT [Patescibacteria group bacterium]|nr:regulatory iron-sulfur-containing complex subunit RicT [Patescibacteria group bacterium]